MNINHIKDVTQLYSIVSFEDNQGIYGYVIMPSTYDAHPENYKSEFAKYKAKVIISSKTRKELNQQYKECLFDYFDNNGKYPKYNCELIREEWHSYFMQYYNKGWTIPFLLSKDADKNLIQNGHQYGNYLYGHMTDCGFEVDYVGRCTNQELKDRIIHRFDPQDNNYKEFKKRKSNYAKIRYAKTLEEAVAVECFLYHLYGGRQKLINNEHPSREGAGICPISICKYNERY